MKPLRAAVLVSTIACAWLPDVVDAQRDARAANPPAPASVQRALMPGGMVADSAFANGCWIRFFDGIDYRGDQLLIVGPLQVGNLKETGEPWRDWDSVVVGPNARLTTYDEEGFSQPAVTLEPGRRVQDLTASTGRFDDIRSVKVVCMADR